MRGLDVPTRLFYSFLLLDLGEDVVTIGKARPVRARAGDGVNGRSGVCSAETRWLRRMMRVGAAALAVATASGASASPLLFTYDDEISANPQHLSFTLDSSPTPYASNNNVTYIYPISVTSQGLNYSGSEVLFYTPVYGGGFQVSLPNAYISASGPQLFSGSTAAPMFAPGTFDLRGGLGTGGGTLTISPAAAPGAPGPEVGLGWVSALASLGALAATRLRRRPIT